MKLLTVDNNPGVLKLVEMVAIQNDWHLETAYGGSQALDISRYFNPHLILLDAHCLRQEGPSLLRKLRSQKDTAIILMVTRGDIEGFAEDLYLQCDDFLSKPFHLFELKLRIRGALSEPREISPILEYGPVRVNQRTMLASVAGHGLNLTPKEYELLLLLVDRQGGILSNQEIIDNVWADSNRASASDVQQYIHHLRQKMKQANSGSDCIRNEKGFGYRLHCGECANICVDKLHYSQA